MAVSNPCDDLGGLISKLKSSIIPWEKVNGTNTQSQTYFTDRKYHRDDRRDRRDRNNRDNRGSRSNGRGNSRFKGKCYVCRKENCRSWKHTEEERNRSRDEYKRQFSKSQDSGRNGNFEDRFKRYVLNCEGQDNGKEIEAFEALVLNATVNSDDDSGTDSDTSYGQVSCFITSTISSGILSEEEAMSASVELANRACNHFLTSIAPSSDQDQDELDVPLICTATAVPYTSTTFIGIIIDTGAANKSTAGHNQFKALQNENPTVSLDSSTAGQVKVQFGIGESVSLGTTEIRPPVGKVLFHVVPADTTFLLFLADMDRLKIKFDNIENVVITHTQDVPVVRRRGHAILLWNSSLQSYLNSSFDENPCYLTDTELRRLHHRFGHPSVERLRKVVEQASHEIDKKALD